MKKHCYFLVAGFVVLFACSSSTNRDEDIDSGGRFDIDTNLCWQHPKGGCLYDWSSAIEYCNNLDLAGYTDWYLPSRDDFIALLGGCDDEVMNGNFGNCNSCADSETCDSLFGADNAAYWSSTRFEATYSAWAADFDLGSLNHIETYLDLCFRCVRQK